MKIGSGIPNGTCEPLLPYLFIKIGQREKGYSHANLLVNMQRLRELLPAPLYRGVIEISLDEGFCNTFAYKKMLIGLDGVVEKFQKTFWG